MEKINFDVITNNLGTKLTPEIEEMLNSENQLEINAENFNKALEEAEGEK